VIADRAAPAAPRGTNGESVSHDQAEGRMAEELRSSRTTAVAALVARYGLVIVVAWFGAMKFTAANHPSFSTG
jgi:hypothetical protein